MLGEHGIDALLDRCGDIGSDQFMRLLLRVERSGTARLGAPQTR
jgi:hypothetical protein